LLEAEAAASGPEALHARLAKADPAAAATILATNTRRLIRALEVIEATGLPFSGLRGKVAPVLDVLKIGLRPVRDELYRRIDARVDQQIESGLVAEVEGLLARGYGVDLPSMSGIGYRQIAAYLLGRSTLREAVQRIKWDTHAFTRHQLNWFRRVTDAAWLDPASATLRSDAVRLVANFAARRL
jgi:tRNA dimethylallyltransferase